MTSFISIYFGAWAVGYVLGWKVRMVQRALYAA